MSPVGALQFAARGRAACGLCSYTQDLPDSRVVLRTPHRGDPLSGGGNARHCARREPAVSITEITTQAQRIEQTISQQRTFANLGVVSPLLALLIACVGLYGAMAYTWRAERARLASGWHWAPNARIIWMVLREVLALSTAGLWLGMAPRG